MSLLDWIYSEPPEFTSLDSFKITGRGTVYIVPCPSPLIYSRLRGREAIIDGKRFIITAIEQQGYDPYKTAQRIGTIGVLVRPI